MRAPCWAIARRERSAGPNTALDPTRRLTQHGDRWATAIPTGVCGLRAPAPPPIRALALCRGRRARQSCAWSGAIVNSWWCPHCNEMRKDEMRVCGHECFSSCAWVRVSCGKRYHSKLNRAASGCGRRCASRKVKYARLLLDCRVARPARAVGRVSVTALAEASAAHPWPARAR